MEKKIKDSKADNDVEITDKTLNSPTTTMWGNFAGKVRKRPAKTTNRCVSPKKIQKFDPEDWLKEIPEEKRTPKPHLDEAPSSGAFDLVRRTINFKPILLRLMNEGLESKEDLVSSVVEFVQEHTGEDGEALMNFLKNHLVTCYTKRIVPTDKRPMQSHQVRIILDTVDVAFKFLMIKNRLGPSRFVIAQGTPNYARSLGLWVRDGGIFSEDSMTPNELRAQLPESS